MNVILDKIIEAKKKEVEKAKAKVPLARLIEKLSSFADQIRGFKEAISPKDKVNLIAEIKKASPVKGVLREDFAPVAIAQAYEASGACALSILTDKKFFQGDLAHLKLVKERVDLPILRKDFIIDNYQIYESLCNGADALLLIAQVLSAEQLGEFCSLCTELRLDAVCEVHSEEDLDKVLAIDAEIIGINNRNLNTFAEDLQVTKRLMQKIPQGKLVISESAIKTSADVKFLQGVGVNAVLIGETFMRSKDIAAKVKELMGS